jgi:hypothetical protein
MARKTVKRRVAVCNNGSVTQSTSHVIRTRRRVRGRANHIITGLKLKRVGARPENCRAIFGAAQVDIETMHEVAAEQT